MPIPPVNPATDATHVFWSPRPGRARSAIAYRTATPEGAEVKHLVEAVTQVTDEGVSGTTAISFGPHWDISLMFEMPRHQLRRLGEKLIGHADDLDQLERDGAALREERRIQGLPRDEMEEALAARAAESTHTDD